MTEMNSASSSDSEPSVETLYHYCSTQSFHAIIQSRSIWLSSLSLSNDTTEGKLVAETFSRLAEKDSLASGARERLTAMVESFDKVVDGLGFCLSEAGDLLSQWRGYAANAMGVSIGFSVDYLNLLAEGIRNRNEVGFSLQPVYYDPDTHERRLEPTYRKAREYINAGAFNFTGPTILGGGSEEEVGRRDEEIRKAQGNLTMTLFPLLMELYKMKSPGFREEREWRLLSYLDKKKADECSYRSLRDRILPYREFPLEELGRRSIDRVILGPKHLTSVDVVKTFMNKNGFGDIEIQCSEVSYC